MHMLLILLTLCLRKPDGISHLFSIAYAFDGNGCYQSQVLPSLQIAIILHYRHHAKARVLLDTTLLHGAKRLPGMKIAPLGLHTSTETGEKHHDRRAERRAVAAP